MDFPKICTSAPFGPSAYLKQISEHFPANSISDDKSSRQRQHRHSAAAAQHNTHAKIAMLNPASRLVYPQPELINLRVQHHQQRWRWSVASRSRRVACLCELLLGKDPSCIYEDRAHTAHNKPQNKNNTAQHTDNQHPNSQPNFSTITRWKTPTSFLSSRRALRSESWGSDIVCRALALLHSRPEAVIFR